MRAAPILLLGLAGCTTSELPLSSVIDRLRVLAVRAEPAEPRPGDTVSFEALVVSPERPLDVVLWFACVAGAADEYGCDVDLSGALGGLDTADTGGGTPSWEELEDAGLIGAEPYLDPSYQVPEDLLDGLGKNQRQEGLELVVQVAAVPEGAEDDSEVELAYKRVPVSEAVTPNHNPDIVALEVDGQRVEEGPLRVEPGSTVHIVPVLAEGAVEDYRYLDSRLQWEDRQEEPYFTYYRQEGSFDQSYDLYPELGVDWTAPEEPVLDPQYLWFVVRDRRGGMGWWVQEVRFEE